MGVPMNHSSPYLLIILSSSSSYSSTLSRTEACRRVRLVGGGGALLRPLRCCALASPGGELDERNFLFFRSGDVDSGAGVADRREERRRVGPLVVFISSPVSDTTLEARTPDAVREDGFPCCCCCCWGTRRVDDAGGGGGDDDEAVAFRVCLV